MESYILFGAGVDVAFTVESATAPKSASRGRGKYIPVNRYIATVSSYTSPKNLPLFPLRAPWSPSPPPFLARYHHTTSSLSNNRSAHSHVTKQVTALRI